MIKFVLDVWVLQGNRSSFGFVFSWWCKKHRREFDETAKKPVIEKLTMGKVLPWDFSSGICIQIDLKALSCN